MDASGREDVGCSWIGCEGRHTTLASLCYTRVWFDHLLAPTVK